MKIEIKDKTIIIDNEDKELFDSYKWCLIKARMKAEKYYVATFINKKTVYLHRLVINAEKGQIVDHINSNSLDCRKINLRISDYSKNRYNANPSINKKSKYKGVYIRKGRNKKYYSMIQMNNRVIYLGSFYTEEEAAEAYNNKQNELYGNNSYQFFELDRSLNKIKQNRFVSL